MTKQKLPIQISTADSLRNQGFVPLPRLWVKREDMNIIKAIADKYVNEVNDIRGRINRVNQALLKQHQNSIPEEDPKLSKEKAWEAYERSRK